MRLRPAYSNEADTIAFLHTTSWQSAYRGMLSNDFLENGLLDNRQKAWRKRFETPSVNQQIFVAEDADEAVGFVCIFAHDDPNWGALIDNLHVLPHQKGKGIGKKLLEKAADWVKTQDETGRYYLWVLAENHAARAFYSAMGGQTVGEIESDLPDGSLGKICRIAWF